MPIRIREIHFKATIMEEAVEERSSSKLQDLDVQAIVAMCVAQVMKKLKLKKER